MIEKQSLLILLQEEIQEEGRLVAGLTPEEKAAYGSFEHWSAKDLLAHIAAWKLLLGQNIAALADGKPPRQPLEDDRENEIIFRKNQAMDWVEVTANLDHANGLLVRQIQAMDEASLAATDSFPWSPGRPLWRSIVGTGYIHPILHLSEHALEKGDLDYASDLNIQMADSLSQINDSPDWQGMVKYNLACYFALTGQKQIAIETLKSALTLNPEMSEWSRQDTDLQSLHGDEAFEALYTSG
ncbi:MAG: ClbS/DfsB family four-helix bundle protein [Anaerolineales bacterium]|nr:ClbS/DfsB family four-helix bundle protein [Anaerolineales bacterium]